MENILDRVSTMDAKREFVASFQHLSHRLLRVSQICNPHKFRVEQPMIRIDGDPRTETPMTH